MLLCVVYSFLLCYLGYSSNSFVVMGVSASGLPYDIGAEVLFNDSSACIWKLNAGSRKVRLYISVILKLVCIIRIPALIPTCLFSHIQKHLLH